jgi:DNA-binding transcriptional MerR regulator
MTTSMTIGQLAKATGVPAKTIRYYEEVGVLPSPGRTRSGYRTYAASGVERLRFVRRARALGLPLARIRTLVAAVDGDSAMRPRLREMVQVQLAGVEAKMVELRALRRDLEQVLRGLERARRARGSCRCLEGNGSAR